MEEVETRKYTITGLVDYTDEQGNIVGQLEVGSVQELPVAVGDAAVANGQAEVFEGEEVAEEVVEDTGASATTIADTAEVGTVDGEGQDEVVGDDGLGEDDTTA